MRRPDLIALLVFAQAFAIAAELRAAEYIVAPTGHDTDPGSLAQPFATIQRAQEAAAPGDTVQVRGGISS